MRRPGLGYVAVAIALAIVFAPRPSDTESVALTDVERGSLAARVLAPTIDAVKLRETDYAPGTLEPSQALWLLCLAGAVLASLCRRIFRLPESASGRLLAAAVAGRGCRAPPVVTA